MNNKDVILAYLNGATKGKGSNLYIEGDKLVNYKTTIAKREGDKIYLVSDKISKTTSIHQNLIRHNYSWYFKELVEVERGDI